MCQGFGRGTGPCRRILHHNHILLPCGCCGAQFYARSVEQYMDLVNEESKGSPSMFTNTAFQTPHPKHDRIPYGITPSLLSLLILPTSLTTPMGSPQSVPSHRSPLPPPPAPSSQPSLHPTPPSGPVCTRLPPPYQPYHQQPARPP